MWISPFPGMWKPLIHSNPDVKVWRVALLLVGNSIVSDLRLCYMQLGEDGWKRVLVRIFSSSTYENAFHNHFINFHCLSDSSPSLRSINEFQTCNSSQYSNELCQIRALTRAWWMQELRDIAIAENVKGKHFFLESDLKGEVLKLDHTGKAVLTVSAFIMIYYYALLQKIHNNFVHHC